jgi:hypothetical protein
MQLMTFMTPIGTCQLNDNDAILVDYGRAPSHLKHDGERTARGKTITSGHCKREEGPLKDESRCIELPGRHLVISGYFHNSVGSQDEEQGMLLGRNMQDYSQPRIGCHERIDLPETVCFGTDLTVEPSQRRNADFARGSRGVASQDSYELCSAVGEA